MADEIRTGPLLRDLSTEQITVERAADDRTRLQFSASSTAPVDRVFGTEILDHDAGAIDMTRMDRGAVPLLFNHNWDDPIGMVDAGTSRGGRLLVDAHLFATERAREVASMIDGGLRNVSIGYQINEVEEESRGTYRVRSWTPLEVSIVTVPADTSVGIGRTQEKAVTVRVTRAAIQPAAPAANTGATQMAEQVAAAGNAEQVTTSTDVRVVDNGFDPVRATQEHKTAIANLCAANKLDERYARHWIDSGASWAQISSDIVKILEERSKANPSSPAKLDMSNSEVRRYSLLRALRAAANKDWSQAGLELEAHKAVMSRIKGQPRGHTSFYVPLDVQQRDMTVAGVSGSNYLVSTDNLASSFIDMLRNRSVVMALGATRLSGLQGNITIPRETAGATAYWLTDESTAITESQPTIGQLSLSPKNVAALTEFSHQLMTQSSPNVEAFLMSVLAKDVALAVDVGALRGSGSNGQPTGITATSSIGTFTVDGTDTIGDLLDAQTDVATANALTSNCAYVTTHAAAALLMKRQWFSSTDTPLWQGNILDGRVCGFRAMASNQMSSGTMIFGDFGQLILAEWGVLELMVNPFSDFTRGLSQIRAWYTCDVGVRYAGAFSYAASVA